MVFFFNDEGKKVYGEIFHNIICLISGKKRGEAAEMCEKIKEKVVSVE